MALVESLGADHVIDYRNHDFTKNANTYDVVFDAVGLSTFRGKPSTWSRNWWKSCCWWRTQRTITALGPPPKSGSGRSQSGERAASIHGYRFHHPDEPYSRPRSYAATSRLGTLSFRPSSAVTSTRSGTVAFHCARR